MQDHVVLVVHCMILSGEGVHIIFKIILYHSQRICVNMKLQGYYTKNLVYGFINFWTSISHRRCNYLKLCPIMYGRQIKQCLAPIRKFCAKDMNKILELDCA